MAEDTRSAKEKMLAGELYAAWNDAELQREGRHTQRMLLRYNGADPDEHYALLVDMLGSVGEGVVVRSPFACDYGSHIHLENNVFLNWNCVLLDVNPIHIGEATQIGPGVQIYTADHPRDPALRRAGLESGKPVVVGSNVWIGGGAIVLPGVTIGDDAIVGAGSVVTRDVAPGTTVAGNPARVLPAKHSAVR